MRTALGCYGQLAHRRPFLPYWRSRIGSALTIHAHFDGKVIIPDEPLDLPRDQALILQIQPVGGKEEALEEPVLSWLAANAVDSEVLPTDLADRHDRYLYGRSSGNEQR